MDVRLRDWVTKQHEEMPATQKMAFLRALKEQPEAVKRFIEANLMDWGTMATMELETLACYDYEGDVGELFEHLQRHFASEVAAV